MAVTDHRKQRRIIQWKWPDRLVEFSEAWDGVEDRATYLTRAGTWSGPIPTPAEIDAEEASYDAAIAALAAGRAASEAEDEIRGAKALLGLVRTIAEARGITEQQMINAIKAKL